MKTTHRKNIEKMKGIKTKAKKEALNSHKTIEINTRKITRK